MDTSLRRGAAWALACLLPYPVLVALVARYGFAFPYWDQWEFIDTIRNVWAHGLSFSDLWAQHNEHRLVFPRLIMLAGVWATDWDIRVELGVNLLLGLAIYLFALRLSVLAARAAGMRTPYWTWPLLSLFIFSLAQWGNYAWGWQLQILLNTAAVLAGFTALTSAQRTWMRWCAAVLAGIVATFSFSNGAAYWLAAIPSLLLPPSPLPKHTKTVQTALWIACAAACLGAYAWQYEKPSYHPTLWYALQHPATFIEYICVYLGGITAYYRSWAAMAAGAVGILFALAACCWLARRRTLWPALAPYAGLALYACAGAGITGVGRSAYGVNQAMASRYCTVALLLWLAIIALLALMRHAAQGNEWPMRMMRRLLLAAAVVLALSTLLASRQGYYELQERARHLAPAVRQLETGEGTDLLTRLYPFTDTFNVQARTERIRFLRERHLGIFQK